MTVDDLTITVPIASPEMRAALVRIAQAFSDADAACGPSGCGDSLGIQHAKPESSPPKGNAAAVSLCRRITRDANRISASVVAFYLAMDPDERRAAKRQRETLREIRANDREQLKAGLAVVYGGR